MHASARWTLVDAHLTVAVAPSSFLLLCSRHSWLSSSLYTSIPFQCKTCGRRIHSQGDMTIHLDWHFAMHKRAATIAKLQGGARWQNWYWDQEEWVHATDVIFGVQKRNAPGISAAGGGGGGAAATATTAAGSDKSAEAKKYAPQSVPADENQKQCMVSSLFTHCPPPFSSPPLLVAHNVFVLVVLCCAARCATRSSRRSGATRRRVGCIATACGSLPVSSRMCKRR